MNDMPELMAKPFEHDGHSSLRMGRGGRYEPCYVAYPTALPTIRECTAMITGDSTQMTTYTHKIVWATSAEDARKVRKEMDK